MVSVNAGINGSTSLFPVDVEADDVAQAAGESLAGLQQDGKLIGGVSIGDAVKARIEEIEHENQAMEDMIKGV